MNIRFLYTLTVLFMLVTELTAASLTITSPGDYQVFQRFSKVKGTVVIEGLLEDGTFDELEVKFFLTGREVSWKRIPYTIAGSSFKSQMILPAGGWYRMEIRVLKDGKILGESAVEHVGVGEVFVVAGQSNSANHGEVKQNTKTKLVSAFNGEGWQLADDPMPGASGNSGSFVPPFGDEMVNRFDVPVGFIACGIGATSVREWLPAGARFPNPPTLEGRVRQMSGGDWESDGRAFDMLISRMEQAGFHGFRAVLWHQGESDANQPDPKRTLPGYLYWQYLEKIIRKTRQEAGWHIPWFVAQASYHVPGDESSPEIRAAQKALWEAGVALEGPDTDALKCELRENDGKGVHFSDKGLKVHALHWAEKVVPWLEEQLAEDKYSKDLPLPGEVFPVKEHTAFVILPESPDLSSPVQWVWYAPTLPGLPGEEETWMFERFLKAGIAVAGIDVGESYGSPEGQQLYTAFFDELTNKHGFSEKAVLLGRSRGGLMTLGWAVNNPDKVAGFAGIYPVCDITSYPGVEKASVAYNMSPEELLSDLSLYNPVDRLGNLAKMEVSMFAVHGDMDEVVPLEGNSGMVKKRYDALGGKMELIIIEGQGHNMWEGFFRCRKLVNFVIKNAD
jgi:hypothetical protein